MEDKMYEFVSFQEETVAYPVLKISGGTDMLHADDITIAADGCSIIIDDGSMDCTMGVAVLMSVYWLFGFQYPKCLKKTFSFFEEYIFQLKSSKSVPLPVLRLHTDLTH